MRKEICISGFGGQGIGLMGFILGKALALYDGVEAVMTQSYGPEARGGASSTNIVVSDEPVDYPFVQQPDVLVAISQEAYTKFRSRTKPGAVILVDQDLVSPSEWDCPYEIPATQIAEDLGRRIVANIVMLGYFTAVTGVASRESVIKAIETSVKPKTVELNLRAFAKGYDYGSQNRTERNGEAFEDAG